VIGRFDKDVEELRGDCSALTTEDLFFPVKNIFVLEDEV
jgi:hypothetical protein